MRKGSFAVIFLLLFATSCNSASQEIMHNFAFSSLNNGDFVYIDASAKNSFGGMNRNVHFIGQNPDFLLAPILTMILKCKQQLSILLLPIR